ncbi:MAG: hybrid sensor histidine kinase/response regulator [Rhodospirillales bacterium]|nr:hybrid sensor histidine kinase/response regulator [Rhodospirillales bacterium]
MDDLLTEFLTETTENLAVIDGELVELERNPSNSAILGNIFRLVHTIKGTCGFLGLPRLEAVAHAGENVLGKLRDGTLPVTADAVTSVLKCIDAIRALLAELEASGQEPNGDDAAIIAELTSIVEGGTSLVVAPSAEVAEEAGHSNDPKPTPIRQSEGYPVAEELLVEVDAAKAAGFTAATESQIAADLAVERSREQARPAPVRGEDGQPASAPKATKDAAPDVRESAIASQSIRVTVDTLDTLMTLVSELVLTRNQLLQIARGRKENEFATPLQRLSHITTELQEGVMKTRMQPVGNAWAKLPRIVRDLAHESGKQIDLQMLGAETEVDRQVLELIKDPLTHMVRNSADHGIESAQERRDAGKSEVGTITLTAFHEGGHIIIELRDDGRGLDAERIRRKAVSSGLISEADSLTITDQQLFHFIFKPGFSTAEKVTTVSGRGVGMDVVRTNIDRIGGNIDLRSNPGIGSTFIIKIPLTLAIVSALIVSCRGLRFALPQLSVLELVRTGTNETRIERINTAPLLRLRDQLLPLVELSRLLQLTEMGASLSAKAIDDANSASEAPPTTTDSLVIVAQIGTQQFGIVVDEVFDTEEIVVKPVAPILHGIPYYAGNTILGDGSVIMILDPNGLASTIEQTAAGRTDAAATSGDAASNKTRLLVFKAGSGESIKAIPLELVARLEEIPGTSVEHAQGRAMLQYRGCLMPLVPFDPNHVWLTERSYPVLVFNDRDRCMGLVVDEIVDILEEELSIEVRANESGLIGSAIIGGRATDIIDAAGFLTSAFADWFEAGDGHAYGEPVTTHRVLLVEDSPFFRNLLLPLLDAAGYAVTAVSTAAEALKLRDQRVSFDAIISDIEMPGMSGFELAEVVRADGNWREIPIIALSSYTSESDLARGHACGFTDYVAKFDREGLMQSLQTALSLRHHVPQEGQRVAV